MIDSALDIFTTRSTVCTMTQSLDSFSDSINSYVLIIELVFKHIYLCGLTWAGDATGSWVIQDDAHTAVKTSSDKRNLSIIEKPVPSSEAGPRAASSVDVGNNNKRDEMRNPRMYLQKRKLLEKPLLSLYNRPFY
ncbi:hypothetical protein HID58_066726 [Brassica napus]|uniref:Uncharacterized protein n=1 Tax=Brassica napus TaxID=3708 RepID=A0ABQ7ZGG2_BRANA|nr:hypothetical protein HID58_066726 [Brassica napus]